MKERTAVVTGAAGTIGMGVVEVLVEQGRRVAMVDMNERRLQQAAARFPAGRVLAVAADICAPDAPARIDDAIRAVWEPTTIRELLCAT